LGGNVHTIKQNTEALLVGSKEIGLEVNVDKTKYMVISRDHNAGRSHNIKIGNSSFGRVEHLKKFWNNRNTTNFFLGRNEEQIEFRECLLSFGAESFYFQFAIRKLKD